MAQKFLGQAGVSQLWSKIKSLLTSKGVGGIVTATSTDGVTYTATVEGVTALTAGLTLTIVPDKASTSISTKLNVNGLGDKYIRQSTTNSTATGLTPENASWLAANKPITIQYDGTQWKTIASRSNASDMNGTVAIANGGTGANNIEDALLNLGIGTASASTFGLLTIADETDETNCQCEDAAITPKALYNLSAYRQVNTAYAVGDKVNIPYNAGLIMECTQAGTTSSNALDTTSVTVGQVITDGGVKWTVKNIGAVDSVNGQTGAVTVEGVPVGTVIAMAANSAPSGYVLCNGAAVSRTTYANLYAKIGTTYGTGDGSTTFNLPNLSEAKLVKSANVGIKGNGKSLNFTEGSKVFTLTGYGSYYAMYSSICASKNTGNIGTSAPCQGDAMEAGKAIGIVQNTSNSGLTGSLDLATSLNYYVKY